MTTSDIRKQCARHKSREPCWIYEEHEDITQAHHVIHYMNANDSWNKATQWMNRLWFGYALIAM